MAGCSSLKYSDCNFEHGYSSGVNDARADLPMNQTLDPDNVCLLAERKELYRGYREGYSVELRTRVAQTHETKPDVAIGSKLFVPECRVGYGDRVCGYGCLTIYGRVRCAKKPGSGCMAAFGDIRCGRDCKITEGRIECASYE